MRFTLMAVLVLAQALPPAGGIQVESRDGRLSIRANGAPLSRILERVSQATGMKVTYETGAPGQLVTADLERLPPPVAITELFEGLGLSYVFRTDTTGQRVEALIVSEGGAVRAAATPTQPPGPPMEFPNEMVEESFEEPPPEFVRPEMMQPPVPA